MHDVLPGVSRDFPAFPDALYAQFQIDSYFI